MPNFYMDYTSNMFTGMADGKYSNNLVEMLNSNTVINSTRIINDISKNAKNKSASKGNIDIYDSLYHANNMRRTRGEIYSTDNTGGNLFNQTFRFGLFNPYGAVSSTREFLFFTKPDLHIMKMKDSKDSVSSLDKSSGGEQLNDGLHSFFWQDMYKSKRRIIRCLQLNYGDKKDPFNHLLQNTVNSNLEVPSLNAPSVETSTNTYGVSLSYRGSSEESDDGPEFSLEFKDDKYLNVYSFFRAYEEYETLKKHGTIKPQKAYTLNKILHDQFAICKFIVGEDMETILYWGKYYGVYPTSLPRDAFSSNNFQDGLTFTINFKAAFYEDMRPEILSDFNVSSSALWKSNSLKRIDIYNDIMHRMDGRAAKVAYVELANDPNDPRVKQNPNQYYYKLSWKGEDLV